MLIEIRNRWNKEVIFSHQAEENSIAITVQEARKRDANLRGANLKPIRDDLFAVLSSAPAEVETLIAKLKAGQVNGSVYEGACSCLVGTLATARGVSHHAIPGLAPNSSRPIERFFLGIDEGDTPETNPVSALAVQWCEDWLANMRAAFSAQVSAPK